MRMRKVTVWIGTAALLIGLIGGVAGTSSAANLTGGQYTYVINGEEVTFPFDPVKVSGGLLMPVEVLQKFNIGVKSPLSREILLEKADVSAQLTLGTTTFSLNGQPATLDTAPLRLNGRLFLPSDLLKHFGVDFSLDGTFAVMRDSAQGMSNIRQLTDSEFADTQYGRFGSSTLKADSNIYLNADFTLLTPELVVSAKTNLAYGTKARLISLLKTNTLVMVKLSNAAFKSGAIQPNSFFLVDAARKQYDLLSTLDTGDGPVTAKISPSADRVGVLVFPRVTTTANTLWLYYDPNGSNVVTFTKIY